ncbi:MAG: type II secretion system F family protein [Candidatus Colwellbacteria bacterium]|nr:type II secretion system F family protein [Candidatus Colwellbacteria bacterium]
MSGQGLRPVSVKLIDASSAGRLGGGVFGQSISLADKIFLVKNLALMLKVGTDLFHAIEILVSDFEKPAVKTLLTEIRDTLSRGRPFYTTFLKYPAFFSPVFVNLIKAGEASGTLEQVFQDLGVSLEKERELRGKISAAFTYPLILLVISSLVLLMLVFFIIPKIATVFIDSGITPPAFSRIVFGVSLFLKDNVAFIGPIFVASIVALWRFLGHSATGRRFVDRMLARLPVVGSVIHELALQRFAATLSSLLKAGLPIIEALEITAEAVGSIELRAALLRISREGIARGITIGEAFRKEPFFPRVTTNLIAISEKAGHMESVLDTLSDFYTTEVDAVIKTLVSFLEPALLLGIGIVIGVIALAIITPIYQLASNF